MAGQLIGLGREGAVGTAIAAALARGAAWRAREALQRRDLAEAGRIAAFIVRAGGRAAFRAGPGGPDPRLTEKRHLEPQDYAW